MATVALLALLLGGAAQTSGPRIEPTADPTRVRVVVKLAADAVGRVPKGKLTQDQGEVWLRLCVVSDETGKDGVAMLGDYARAADTLTFTPRFPLRHGQRYRARFGPAEGKTSAAEYRVPPRPPSPPAVVTRVYPSAAVLPANHLRFHIHFSEPMRGGKAIFDQIRILTADGKEVFDPWLRDELWRDDQTLILYIHPGRIKWGLLLRLLLGPVLVPNREYTLVIGPEIEDAKGRRLGKAFAKKFRTTAEDRVRIELAAWKVQAPAAGTRRPLVLSLPQVIDRVGLESRLAVVDAAGKEVVGKVEVGAEERSWSFRPAQPWKAAAYRVEVDGELEDVAGNTPLRAFDTDLKAKVPPPQKQSLPFQPRPAPASSARPQLRSSVFVAGRVQEALPVSSGAAAR